jgi:hypothetical protein
LSFFKFSFVAVAIFHVLGISFFHINQKFSILQASYFF